MSAAAVVYAFGDGCFREYRPGVEDELTRLASVASLSAHLLEELDSPELGDLVDDRLRSGIRVLNARALAAIADLEHPRVLRLVPSENPRRSTPP